MHLSMFPLVDLCIGERNATFIIHFLSTFLDEDQLPAMSDPDVCIRPMAAVHFLVLYLRHKGHVTDHMTKDDVNAEAVGGGWRNGGLVSHV